MRNDTYLRLVGFCVIAGLAEGFAASCAELQAAPRSAEAVIDELDDAIVGVSAAYNAVCLQDAEPAPSYCADAKQAINRVVRSRNALVAE